MLIRRRRVLEPLRITSTPAPVLGAGHDVTAVDDVPPSSTAVTFGAIASSCPVSLVEEDLVAGHEPLELVNDAPSIDRGTCYHDLHFEHDGRRFGALIHPHQHSASLLPCPYLGRAGR